MEDPLAVAAVAVEVAVFSIAKSLAEEPIVNSWNL